MDFKILLLGFGLLFTGDIDWGRKQTTFEGFFTCPAGIKKSSFKFEIHLAKESSNSDTLFYKLYFDDALGFLGHDYSILKVYKNRYFLGLHGLAGTKLEKPFYEFMDLDADVGSRFLLSNFFFRFSTKITLDRKVYSEFLNDQLFFYSLSDRDCLGDASHVNEFVYSKKFGFVRFGFCQSSGCTLYFYQKHTRKKWINKDAVLSKLFVPG